MQDLPVAISLPGALGAEVAAWAETSGWQVVALDGVLRPTLVLADAPVPGRPTAVVVAGVPSGEQVRAGLHAGAVDVVGWPQDRERLRDLARASRTAPVAGAPLHLAVAGAAGGTGTSTVALAVGALLAWSGRSVVVVGDDDLLALCGRDPWTGPGAGELALLDPEGAAAELPALARPVPGVPGLGVLGGGGACVSTAAGWPVDAVVTDGRTEGRGSAALVCARPDVHLAAAAGLPGAVLLVGDGPLDAGQVRAVLGRAPAGRLPTSARVARAAALGRVPSGLPGTWLRDLREALRRALR